MTNLAETNTLQEELSPYLDFACLTSDNNNTFSLTCIDDNFTFVPEPIDDTIELLDSNSCQFQLSSSSVVTNKPQTLAQTDSHDSSTLLSNKNVSNLIKPESIVKILPQSGKRKLNKHSTKKSKENKLRFRGCNITYKLECLKKLVQTGESTLEVVPLKDKSMVFFRLKDKDAFPLHVLIEEDCNVNQTVEKQPITLFDKTSLSKDRKIWMPCLQTSSGFRIWLCPRKDCNKAFYRHNSAKLHSLQHLEYRPHKCDFPKCDWAFYSAFKLKRHLETHLKRKDFSCPFPGCNRQFTTIYNLKWHRRHCHDNPAKLPCFVQGCDKLFCTSKARETHLKNHTKEEAPFKCSISDCTKSFFLRTALDAHLRLHEQKNRELKCNYPNCGKVFVQPCRLKQHQRQHTGQRPYGCPFENCKWAFSTASKLKRHLSTHTNERKFHCTMGNCNKSFLRSEHLKDHTLTHIGQRSFQCNDCDACFTGKAKLCVHMKKAHPKETKTENVEYILSISNQEPSSEEQIIDDLEQAIQSLDTDFNPWEWEVNGSLLPEAPMDLLSEENFSTVNLRDLE